MLLCGVVLSTKVIFLQRFFTAWRAQRAEGVAKPFDLSLLDAIGYHAGVTLLVIGIVVGQLYALARDYAVTPALVVVMLGLLVLEVFLWRGAQNLTPPASGD
jgi:hypothetical protein